MKDFCVDTWRCATILSEFIKRESTIRTIHPLQFFTSYHDDIVNSAMEQNKKRRISNDNDEERR